MTIDDSVSLSPDGYIEVLLVGDQTEESFRYVYRLALPMMDDMRSKGQQVRCLIDCTKQTGFSLSSDKVAMELLEQADYDKLALCKVPHAEVTKGIVMATGKSNNTKIFDEREEAIAWLLEKPATD